VEIKIGKKNKAVQLKKTFKHHYHMILNGNHDKISSQTKIGKTARPT